MTQPEPTLGGSDGERRHVTVLCADIAGSTAQAEQLGEEANYEIVQRIIALMTEVVRDQGGTVQDIAGDSVMALFGAPQALENAPLRACQAGLAIQERLPDVSRQIESRHGVRPAVRVGINSGPVVFGQVPTGQGHEQRAVGDTLNLAARIQSIADPNQVLLGATTHNLVAPFVDSAFTGEHALKGKSAGQAVWRLDGIKASLSRFEARAGGGLTAFIGRGPELETLRKAWQQAKAGAVRFVNVVGEAGIGKSRLVHEFASGLEADGIAKFEGYGSLEGQTVPFQPFIELVRRALRIGDERSPDAIRKRLADGLDMLGLSLETHLPFLAHLLDADQADDLANIESEVVGIRTRETLLEMIGERARISPIVLVVDDLHWIDSATEALLMRFAESNVPLPVLVICGYRPDYRAPWTDRSNVDTIEIWPLTEADTAALIRHRLGDAAVTDELARWLVEKSDGNPLFAEEMGAFILASGDTVMDAHAMPESLQDLLMNRVDRLPAEPRQVLRVAAVIGRRFAPALVGDVLKVDGSLAGHLAALRDHDLVFAEGEAADAHHQIKHALIQDTVYESLLGAERAALHLAVAQAVERRFADNLDEVADCLAFHYRQTDQAAKTIAYLHDAGQKSLRVYSLREAGQRFRDALDLIEANPGVVADGLTIDIALGMSRINYLDGNFRSIRADLPRYGDMAATLGDKRRLARYQFELGFAGNFAGKPADARPLLEQSLQLGEELDDQSIIGYATFGLAMFELFWTETVHTDPAVTEALCEKAIAIGEALGDAYLAGNALTVLGLRGLLTGRAGLTRSAAARSLDLAKRTGDPIARQFALMNLGYMDVFFGAPADALNNCEEAMRLGLTPITHSTIRSSLGAALVLTGRLDEALPMLEAARAEMIEKQCFLPRSGIDLWYGIALVMSGQMATGCAVIRTLTDDLDARGHNSIQKAIHNIALGEIYLGMVTAAEKPGWSVIWKNLGFLLRTLPVAKKKARAHFKAALDIATRKDTPGSIAWAHLDLGKLAEAQNRPDQARTHYHACIEQAARGEIDGYANQARERLAALG